MEALIQALQDENDGVRMGAGYALTEIGTEAVEPLMAALSNPAAQLREQAAELLGDIQDARGGSPERGAER